MMIEQESLHDVVGQRVERRLEERVLTSVGDQVLALLRRVVDTGGIVPDDKALIPSEIFRQARVALEEADAIVLVVDGRTEPASPDIELARQLLRTGKPLTPAFSARPLPLG